MRAVSILGAVTSGTAHSLKVRIGDSSPGGERVQPLEDLHRARPGRRVRIVDERFACRLFVGWDNDARNTRP